MNSTQQASEMKKINCDQEAWLLDALTKLVVLGIEIDKHRSVGADKCMVEGALQGAISHQALEILLNLNLEPEYTNLPRRTWRVSDSMARNKSMGIGTLVKPTL